MKFRLSFKVHSSLFVDGTRNILILPGLVKFSASHGMLKVDPLFEGNNGTVYIAHSYLTENGFTDIGFEGDGVQSIKLTVNNTIWTLYKTKEASYYRVSGFSDSSYLKMPFPFNDADSWEFILHTYVTNTGSTSYPRYMIANSTNNLLQGLYARTEGASYYMNIGFGRDGSSIGVISTNNSMYNSLNKNALYKMSYSGISGYKVECKIENSEYSTVGQVSSTTKVHSNYDMWIGNNYGNYSDSIVGYIDLMQCSIVVSGIPILDIRNGINPLITVGELTVSTDRLVYPTLSLGQLTTYQNSWLVLKDIEALKLEA